MKKLLITASLLLAATATGLPSQANLRQEYQQYQSQQNQEAQFQAYAYNNAQYIAGSSESKLDLSRRIFISQNNEVFLVTETDMTSMGYTDRVKTGCRWACTIAESLVNQASINAGGLTDFTQIESTEEWQYYIEGDYLVEYTSSGGSYADLKGNSGKLNRSSSRKVVAVSNQAVPSYYFKEPIQPYHPDNVTSSSNEYDFKRNCMLGIAYDGVRTDECSKWERENPEIGFQLGKEVIGQNGWTWCLSRRGFINVHKEGRDKCEGTFTTRLRNGEKVVYVAGMSLPNGQGSIVDGNGQFDVDSMATEAIERIFGF